MRYGILGATEAHGVDGARLPLGGARLRALLAALALRPGRHVPLEVLIDEVWGDDPPTDAPAALQALVGRLRRLLGRERITLSPGGYRLDAAEQDIDLFVFERLHSEGTRQAGDGDAAQAVELLDRALRLWRGTALTDLADPRAGARAEAQRMEAVRARAAARLRLGQADLVVPELRELTAAHPYDEALAALLLRALRSSGRQAAALAAYDRVRRTLQEGLGADPGPELRALHAELLRSPEEKGDGDGGRTTPSRARGTATGPDGHFDSGRRNGLAHSAHRNDLADSGRRDAHSDPARDKAGDSVRPAGAASWAGTESWAGARTATAPAAAPEAAAAPPASPYTHGTVGNLRPRLTSFVGREQELAGLRAELSGSRLVTLTGPGGSGKTRLAEEAASVHPGAWLVELAPLDLPEAVPGAVVTALGLRETVLRAGEAAALPDDPVALLVTYCAGRELVLVLDNCEHVIDAAAALAETLLTRCPGLTVLATSREPLGVPGEFVRPVEPLPQDRAVRLFTERAAAVRPGFDAEGQAEAVAEICRRLDGLPLAIELAAARLRLLTPRQIADRLDDRFRLLTSGSRTLMPRQQTLRAVVDWSWDLLEPAERTVLRQVSVFAGGWDLEAAEAVCDGSAASAADLIGALVDKSLVVAAPSGPTGAMRYRLLETIHEYARERAAEVPGVTAEATHRHNAFYCELVATADPLLRTADQLRWIHRLEADLDNLRAVAHRLIAAGDADAARELALNLSWFWWLRNYRQEAGAHIAEVLAMAPEPEPAPGKSHDGDPRVWVHRHLSLLSHLFTSDGGPLPDPDEENREQLKRLCELYDRPVPQAAGFPGLLWPFALWTLDGTAVVGPAMDRALANCRTYGSDWALGVTLMFRTHVAVDLPGGALGAENDLQELRRISRRVGDRWMRAQVCSAAAEMALNRGDTVTAEREYEEALRLAHEVGAHAETPFLRARMASVAHYDGNRDDALRQLAIAEADAERYGTGDAALVIGFLRGVVALDELEEPTALRDTAAAAAAVGSGAGDPPSAALVHARDEIARARHLFEYRGTAPPQLVVVVAVAEARLAAAEEGASAALPLMLEAARNSQVMHCADVIVSHVFDRAAVLLAELDDPLAALRFFAAGEELRGAPRPHPERILAERVRERVRSLGGAELVLAEEKAGTKLGVEGVIAELARAAGESEV